jgi:hypothetical protein
MVNAPMSDTNSSRLDDHALRVQIEKNTWLELTKLCERIVDSFGVIGPKLDLAKDKSDAEKLESIVAIKEISTKGHAALKEFAVLWARLDEQAYKQGIRICPEDLEDLRQEARWNPIPELGLEQSPGKNKRGPEAMTLRNSNLNL